MLSSYSSYRSSHVTFLQNFKLFIFIQSVDATSGIFELRKEIRMQPKNCRSNARVNVIEPSNVPFPPASLGPQIPSNALGVRSGHARPPTSFGAATAGVSLRQRAPSPHPNSSGVIRTLNSALPRLPGSVPSRSFATVNEEKGGTVLNSRPSAQPIQSEHNRKIEEMEGNIRELQVRCRAFYVRAIKEIKTRFVFDDSAFQITEILRPENVCKTSSPSLAELFIRFPVLNEYCDRQRADQEWRELDGLSPKAFCVLSKDKIKFLSVDEYWDIVFSLKMLRICLFSPI